MATDNTQGKVTDQNDGANGALDDDDDDDPVVTQAQGGDLKAALAEERGKRKAAQKEAKEAKEKLAKAEPLVKEYEELVPHLPGLLQAAQRGAGQQPVPAGGSNGPTPEQQELLELAQDLGLEDDKGQPDLARAARVQARIQGRVERTVQTTLKPVQETAQGAALQQVRERAYKVVDKEGRPFATREAIDQVFNSTDPRQLLDPQGASAAMLMARGISGPGEVPDEPLHVEGAGRVTASRAALSQLEKNVAKLRGKSEKDWGKMTDDNPVETGNWELEA